MIKNINFDEISLTDIFNFSEKLSDTMGRMRKKMAIGIHSLDAISGDLSFEISQDSEFIPLKSNTKQLFSQILANNEKGKKYGQTLENNNYPVLKDSKGIIALVPIINSDRTAVNINTKNLFIEVTGTSKYLVDKITDVLSTTFVDIGGDLFPIIVTIKNKQEVFPKLSNSELNIPISQISNELGIKLTANNILSLANKVGYDAVSIGNKIRFRIPQYRMDILNDQDIVEDIGIAYGYDYIPFEKLSSIIPGKLLQSTEIFETLSNSLVGLGFTESMSTYLTNENKNFKLPRLELPNSSKYISLKNSKSNNITMARTWILPSLLNVIALSKHDKMPQRVFELDIVFDISDGKPNEKYHLSAISVDSHSNFNFIKSVIESILSISGIPFSITELSHNSFIEGRCASIIINGTKKGFFGEINPLVLKNFGIEEPSVAFELEL